MNRKFVLLVFASVFLLSAVIGAQLIVAVAALRTVGVHEGDWAEYSVTVSGNSTEIPLNITSVMVTIQQISGTNVTSEMRIHYDNGTEETQIFVLDVDTGQGNGTYSPAALIAANLNEGDPIYNYSYSPTINETIYRTYLGRSVQVNHLNITMSYDYETTTVNYYWYRSTGMMAEMSMYQLSQMDGTPTWAKIEILIIDMIPEFPPALILPLFMIVTLTAVWLGKTIWSNKKSKKSSPYA